MGYPLLEIDTELIYRNASTLRQLCQKCGVEPTAVIKGYNAIGYITEAIVRAGFTRLGSSRLPHLKQVKEDGHAVETLALRPPMLSELPELVRYADISLNSEEQTLRELDAEARRQGKIHKVILMRDLGDLREGLWERQALYKLAELVENQLPHLLLYGVGANLTCYGAIVPTTENLSELVEDAREIERRIGRRLDIVSGGATSSLPLIIKGGLPEGVTDLRIGEALLVPCDLLDYWNCPVPELSNRSFLLRAEVIECNAKPTVPVGQSGPNIFRNKYEDRGIRQRAILALGLFDVGDYNMLLPCDPGLTVMGSSSDHLIVDIHDSQRDYQVGDIVDFELSYKAMLFATGNPLVEKIRVR